MQNPADSQPPGLTVYFTDVDAGNTETEVESWGKLPERDQDEHESRTEWGTEKRYIPEHGSAWIRYSSEFDRMALKHNAFINTGQRAAIRSIAFSEMLFSDIYLLMVAKEEGDTMQFWSIQGTSIKCLKADVLIFAALVKWTPNIVLAEEGKGIIAVIAPNATLSFFLVELSNDTNNLSVKPSWSYDNPSDVLTCIDTCPISGESSSRVICGTSAGHVLVLSLNVLPQSCHDPQLMRPEWVVRIALHCGPIRCISWMAGETGIWFAVGNNQGKLILCDRRKLDQPEIASLDTITRPFTAMVWPSQTETILGCQMDAFVLSTTFVGMSRFNPLKTIYDIKSKAKKPSTKTNLEYWSRILFPPYRVEKAVKLFEVSAIGCCATGNLACFTFDSGCAITGAVSDFDVKSFDSVRVFLWSILEGDADINEAFSTDVQEEVSEESKSSKLPSNRIIEGITAGIEQARLETIKQALLNGVHITACNHSSLERIVRSFGVLKEQELNVSDMRQADALQLGAAAATPENSNPGYVAYGGGLGLIHLIGRP